MISKSTVKFIKSLQLKKYRKIEQAFLVEGAKSVLETLKADFTIRLAVVTNDFLGKNKIDGGDFEVVEVNDNVLSSLGTFKTNDSALLVVEMKPNAPFSISDEFALALDGVNDPGNLGTIIRVADWYGIKKILASENTVDLYNPKVIAASKGSFCRVDLYYTDLEKVLKEYDLSIYGADMEGSNVHKTKFGQEGIIVMGNEANGISPNLETYINQHISIPRFGQAESLNVAMATAVICDNIRRND